MTDREQLCKEFTELTGGHWHELVQVHPSEYNILTCLKCGENGCINPTYENPADVLRVMMKRDDCDDFLRELQKNHWLEIEEFIEKYILEPDALMKQAAEFLKEERK